MKMIDLRPHLICSGTALHDEAGPADWWLEILHNPGASDKRRDQAARELRLLGAGAVNAARRRRIEILAWLGEGEKDGVDNIGK